MCLALVPYTLLFTDFACVLEYTRITPSAPTFGFVV